jgi:glutaredoxin-related protein
MVAAEPLPRQIPGLSVMEVASLEPLSDAAQINAAQGSDIARRIGHTYVYRTTIPQLLITGDLVTSADVQTINSMSVSLASSLVEDATALSDLPTPEFASDLNDAAHGAVERYASWQDEYLSALADGDEDAARTLIAELAEIRTELNAMLEVALGVARIDIDLQIVELADSLESFLEDLTRQ